mmetsp:Transcript_134246/g.233285  ORF Transcript_134246/g.233285 Transcript_134246/m.233285 type:complete len:523 (-) Transcript_134246:49-1617(-)
MSFEAFRQSLSQGKRNEKTFRDRPCVRMRASQGSSFASRADSFDSCEDDFNPDDLMTEFVCEKQRLEYLEEVVPAFHRQDEEPYSSVVNLIRSIFHVPIVLVSLVYDEFQWFKAGVGLEVNQTPRCQSFCAHTFEPRHPEVLYIPDALDDSRFCDNPLVLGPPFIRFYCGVPLVTMDDVRLGTLCIIEDQPRRINGKAMQILINLAELTVRELLKHEVGRRVYRNQLSAQRNPPPGKMTNIARAHAIRELWFERGLQEAVLIVDAGTSSWPVIWANTEMGAITKFSIMQSLWRLVRPLNGQTEAQVQESVVHQLKTTKSHVCVKMQVNEQAIPEKVGEEKAETGTCLSCKMCFAHKTMTNATQLIHMTSSSTAPRARPIDMKEGLFLIIRATPTQYDAQDQPNLGPKDDTTNISFADSNVENDRPSIKETPKKQGERGQGKADNEAYEEASLVEAFRCLDKRQTGEISKKDFTYILDRLAPGVAEQRIEAILDVLGFEDNGRVRYVDFIKWLTKGPSQAKKP